MQALYIFAASWLVLNSFDLLATNCFSIKPAKGHRPFLLCCSGRRATQAYPTVALVVIWGWGPSICPQASVLFALLVALLGTSAQRLIIHSPLATWI